MLLFPGLKVIRRQSSIRLDRGRRTNGHHDQRPLACSTYRRR
jgi:hypothetical protein